MTSDPRDTPERTASDDALAQLLVCNGIDATTGGYLLPPMDMRQLAQVATGLRLDSAELGDLKSKARRARQANFAVVEGVDASDLAQAGWAVVFPQAAEGSEAARRHAQICEAMAPLLSHRRAAAGELYREYTGERGYCAGETKQQYLGRLGAGPGLVQPKKVPYYLLLVATPEEIPFHIQYQLDVQYAVGRIAFDTLDEYARYAQSVVDAETGRAVRPRRAAFFGVANPNDVSTRTSADHLVIPLIEHADARRAHHGFAIDRHLGDAATRDRLIELLRDPPALLFTASHGMGFPSGDAGQRDRQGALLCQDWPGPKHPVAREHYLAGEDLPAGADLRGMIGVLFACYGGGTPTHDEFARRGQGGARARELAPAPVLARLPQRMLGHPTGGALAVVGHVDRAWGSTFLWIDAQRKTPTQRHLDCFESMLDSVMAGKRLGHAMESFNLRYAELAAALSERIQEIQSDPDEPYEESELAHMWIYNNDARNYAVIGDPAARIPGPDEHAPARRAPFTVRGPQAAPTSDPRPQKAAMPDGSHEDETPDKPEPPDLPSYGWFGDKDDKQPGALARLGNRVGEVLGEVLGDAAVLEVKTYVSEDLHAVASGEPLNTTGARLRAYTRCKLDGDTEVCVPVNAAGAVDEALWNLHLEMVKQAQAHRVELIRTVLSLFSSRVGK